MAWKMRLKASSFIHLEMGGCIEVPLPKFKLLSPEELEKEFRLEKVYDIRIRAIGGRFVISLSPINKSEMK